MFIANKRNYPKLIVDSVVSELDRYDKGDADYSVTDIIGSPLPRILKERHKAELTVDVDRLMFMFYGSMAHAVLERLEEDYIILKEHRMFLKVNSITLSGCLDVVYKHKGIIRLDDLKFTSKGVANEPAKTTWKRQANLYRFMLKETKGIDADELGILAYFRNSTMYEQKCGRIPITKFSDEQVMVFLERQIALHRLMDDPIVAQISECTPDDRWEQPEIFAVMPKPDAKRSLKNFTTESDAIGHLEEKLEKYPDAVVQHRPAYQRKCAECCDVSKYCWWWNDYQEGYITESYDLPEGEEPTRREIGKA